MINTNAISIHNSIKCWCDGVAVGNPIAGTVYRVDRPRERFQLQLAHAVVFQDGKNFFPGELVWFYFDNIKDVSLKH